MSKIVLTYEDKVEACKEYFNKFNFTIRLKSEIDKEMKENGGV